MLLFTSHPRDFLDASSIHITHYVQCTRALNAVMLQFIVSLVLLTV